ncbi:DUF1963 domain-containing protein [Aeoliella sp.]|uniref:DUF1963 domain-containing protein n=1 Tax=Aeoliella sp. TaxID=2795800 RepID=UPI003CCB91C7
MMTTQLSLASSLPDEQSRLADVIADMADHSRKRAYATWLDEQGDPRGAFLNDVLDQWDAGAETLPTNDTLSMVWQRTCGVTLLQMMRSEKLDTLASLFPVCRPALMINLTLADSELPVGTSKFGGKPDLPDGESWPEFNGNLHTFIGQINLAEIAITQLSGELPAKGLLSFFIFDDPIETGQPAAEGEPGAWKVIFTPDLSSLQRHTPPKAFDEGNALAPECALEFEETLDLPYASMFDLDQDHADLFLGCRRAKELGLTKGHTDAYEELQQALMPEREQRSHLLGWSHPQVAADDPVDEGFRNLLTVASEELCEWCWADGHLLYFGISDEDLKNHRFDRTTIIDG